MRKKANREVELPLSGRFAEMDTRSSLVISQGKPACVRFQSEVFWPEVSESSADLEPPLSELMRAASQVWGKPLRSTGEFDFENENEIVVIPVEEGTDELPAATEGWAKLLAERQRSNRQVRLAVDESITGAGVAAYLQISGGKARQIRYESSAFWKAANGAVDTASGKADAAPDGDPAMAPELISRSPEIALVPSLGTLTGAVMPELLRAASQAWGKPLDTRGSYSIEPGALVIRLQEKEPAQAVA
ncbi:hypothetical protein P2318_34710 [Myxococcaceae bacterium GXIMD 01537]